MNIEMDRKMRYLDLDEFEIYLIHDRDQYIFSLTVFSQTNTFCYHVHLAALFNSQFRPSLPRPTHTGKKISQRSVTNLRSVVETARRRECRCLFFCPSTQQRLSFSRSLSSGLGEFIQCVWPVAEDIFSQIFREDRTVCSHLFAQHHLLRILHHLVSLRRHFCLAPRGEMGPQLKYSCVHVCGVKTTAAAASRPSGTVPLVSPIDQTGRSVSAYV